MSLKRYQVLLSDWMENYVKFVADRYDLTISEVIRGHMCFGFLYAISMMYPEYKSKLESEKFGELSKKKNETNFDKEEFYQFRSKIIFEARKAVEFKLSKEN